MILNLSSQQKDKDGQLLAKTKEIKEDSCTIKADSKNNKEELHKKVKKNVSKFSIVNLLFNR